MLFYCIKYDTIITNTLISIIIMAKQKGRSEKISNKAKNAGQKKSNPFEVGILHKPFVHIF